jgi:hypothetical protein
VKDKIYLMGTKKWHEAPTSAVFEYDPATDSYAPKKPMNTARSQFTTSVVNDKIYAFGGSVYFNSEFFASVEEYDPALDTWTFKAEMPAGARNGLASAVINGKIYVIGGYVVGDEAQVLSTVEEYDPATDTWMMKAPVHTARCWLSTSVVDNKIYAIGGIAADGQPVSTVEEYNPATDTWKIKSDMLTARWGLGSNAVNGTIFTFGGAVVTTEPWGPGLSTVEAYDPKLDTSVEIRETDTVKPLIFTLMQNYPNPFNPTTTIAYDLPKAGHVRLVIYDVLGRRIRTLVDKQEQAGRLQTAWDGTDERGLPVAGGVYFCRMQTGDYSRVIKMALVR